VVAGAAFYPANQGPNDWFNSAAFVTPAAYTYGKAGRDILVGPNSRNNDIGLQRSAAFKERFTPVNPERQFQLGLHLSF
jgi:hypothetical protein